MRTRQPPFMLHGPLLVVSIFSTLVIGRILSLSIPSEFYFTFQSLFSDRSARNQVLALIGKMLAPALTGVAYGWLVYRQGARTSAPAGTRQGFRRRLRRQWVPTAFVASFFAAFLSAWPIIVYWDLLANPLVLNLHYLFFTLYALYMVAYGYMAVLGTLGIIYVLESYEAVPGGPPLVSRLELSRVGALWLINSSLASVLLKLLTK